MEEYPRNRLELEAAFSTEAASRDYLARLRWPEGFRCPHCGAGKAWPVCGVLLECATCRFQTSVIAGTIFQDTRTPLPVWFRAMWWLTKPQNGASALGLQRVLGLKSYETAWTWLHINRRTSKSRGKLFYRLAQQAVAADPVPLQQILHPAAKEKSKPQQAGPT